MAISRVSVVGTFSSAAVSGKGLHQAPVFLVGGPDLVSEAIFPGLGEIVAAHQAGVDSIAGPGLVRVGACAVAAGSNACVFVAAVCPPFPGGRSALYAIFVDDLEVDDPVPFLSAVALADVSPVSLAFAAEQGSGADQDCPDGQAWVDWYRSLPPEEQYAVHLRAVNESIDSASHYGPGSC